MSRRTFLSVAAGALVGVLAVVVSPQVAVAAGRDGQPSVSITHMPRYGSSEDLEGRVENIAPDQYAIAVYICVNGSWWTKPFWEAPLTTISEDGTWTCAVATGGMDHLAKAYAAFALPRGTRPPLLSGSAAFPASLFKNSVAHTQVSRGR